jgi:predicted dehydrogenase
MIEHRGNRVAVVGLKKAFMPSTQKVIEVFGEPSEVKSLIAEYPMSIPDDGQQVLAKRQVTNWLSNGVHPLSLLMAVAGPVEAVTVVKSRNGAAACLLDFVAGALGNFHMADAGPPYFTHERYAFYGNNCEMEIDNGLRVTLRRGIPFDYANTTSFAPAGMDTGSIVWEPQNFLATLENMSLFTQGFYFSMRHFCDSILENKPATQGTLEHALELMRVYEAALLSLGDRIPVAQIS